MIEKTTWFQLQPLYKYIRQQSENRQFFRYLEIGGTFLLMSIFLFSAILPTATAISSLVGDIKSKETLSAAMSTKITNIMQAQDSFSQVQGNYSVLESSYPSLPNFYKSASVFSYISKESSTPIKQIRFQLDDNSTDTKKDTFGINLNTVGSYRSLIDSIEKISNNRRLVDIKSIQISQINDKQTNTNQLNLTVSADLYFLSKDNAQK